MTAQAPTTMYIDALPAKETLTIEFKRDWQRLPDSELVEALVCLANTDGGELWLGVEDDGTASGLLEVATASGVYLRRRLNADGTPQCVAMLPHDGAKG